MTFHVYPDPQTAPLKVPPPPPPPPNQPPPPPPPPTFVPFGQLTGASDPAGAYPKMMFIRVAAVGTSLPPTLFVKAGAGTEVPVGPFSAGVENGTAFIADVLNLISEPNGVFQIRLGFYGDTAETWQLGFRNNDTVEREFTWVVAESAAETAQPWLAVPPAQVTYHALVGESIPQSVKVANKGTAAFSVTGLGAGLPPAFSIGVPLPQTVPPSGTLDLPLTFAAPATPPAPNGSVTAAADLTITPADTTSGTGAGHNRRLSVLATAQRLEVVLLLDSSGSMAWQADGQNPPPGVRNARWDELADAAGPFLGMLAHFGHGHGSFGIARFPAAGSPASFDVVPMTDIPTPADMKPAQDAVALIKPVGGTPMGDGLDHVANPPTSFFRTDDLSVAADRRWLILMSDGAHNSGTHNPKEFSPPPKGTAPAGASLLERRIELFAIAYGLPQHSDVQHDVLHTLAEQSLAGGEKRDVDVEGITADTLAQALSKAITSGLTNASTPADPRGVFRFDEDEKLHEAVLTLYDTRAAFALHWNTPDRGRLRLELITPDCELITPENAGQGRYEGITFLSNDRSHTYLIDPSFLRGGSGGTGVGARGDVSGATSGGGTGGGTSGSTGVTAPGVGGPSSGAGSSQAAGPVRTGTGGGGPVRARSGTWRLVITAGGGVIGDREAADATSVTGGGASGTSVTGGGAADSALTGDSSVTGGVAIENYVYEVLTDSTLRMTVDQDRPGYFAGDPITLTARISADGRPVTGAAVTVSTTAPAESFNNFIAAARVPEDALRRAQEILANQDASPLLVKQLGARLAGIFFAPTPRQVTLPMTDPEGDGTYRATFGATSVPEHYTFFVSATGVTADGVSFHREATQETFVQVRPEPQHTALDLQQSEPGAIEVTVTPRDRFGNVLLIDPATTGGFGLTALGGRPGGLSSALDGSYRGTVTFDPKATPAIGLQFGGQDVVIPTPAPPIEDLDYADRVIRFDPGAIESANQHAEPRAVLGTVLRKPPDKFVSLGARGVLVAAIDHHIILPGGGDQDVTVFVRPDTDPRAYRVEAFSVDHQRWVLLGESPGVTETFALRRGKLKFSLAIRVTDLSARTRDDQGIPLTTPGVSLRGIGVIRTSRTLPCRRDQLPNWFPWPRATDESESDD